jgi:hypothetical protein
MSIVIVPNALRDAINAKLDVVFKDTPEAEKDRDYLYNQIILFYNEKGYIPDFSLSKKESER